MGARKRKPPEAQPLPGMDDVVDVGPPSYRIEPGTVKQSHVDAVLAGRADHVEKWKKEPFDALVRVLVSLRIESFDLPFDTYDGGVCAVVRKKLKTTKPSEMALAIRGAANDEWARKRKPSMAALLARVPEYLALADAPPQVRPRADVIAEFLRLQPAAREIDWWRPWGNADAVDGIEEHNTAVIEKWNGEMRAVIEKSKLSDERKRDLLGARRR
jgi:hypothetical protein